MPYPNEHSARVRDPGDFKPDSFRRKEVTDGISIVMGRLKGETSMTTQAYRFDKDKFTATEAKKWLKEHDVEYSTFEPASEQHSAFLLDDFATVVVGEPYRLLPFGRVVKGGIKHDITPDYAAAFRLPHFKPPIKLGSHEEQTPAGGFIVGLEVRGDGLYCIPEWNAPGEKALLEGAYRYHSPEVVWDGYYEDPTTGAPIIGPLIIGDALLHTPHLGEAAALFRYETYRDKETTMEDTISVPKTLWAKFEALLKPQPVESEKLEKVVPAETFDAMVVERDALKAKIEQAEAAQKKQVEVTQLIAELQKKDGEKATYGFAMLELKSAEEAAGILAGMTPEQREWCMRNFKAYAAQVDESKLSAKLGSSGGGASDNPVEAFDAAIRAKSAELKTDYMTALRLVATELPELYEMYKEKK